ATFNVAIDCIREKPALPKALEHIRENFDYLLKLQRRYAYTVFLIINITPLILCESPRGHTSASFGEQVGQVDELLDYLIDRNRAGYAMVNSTEHLRL